MAEKPRSAGSTDEPSIEEILGSIRRIIAEDDEVTTPPEMAEEPLELTNKIEQDGTIVQSAPEPVPESIPEPAPEIVAPPTPEPLPSAPEPEPTPEEKHEPTIIEEPTPPAAPSTKVAFEEEVNPMPSNDTPVTEELLSDTTAQATAAVMAKLARRTAIVDEGHEGATIEAIVRQMLKPMLREWLDSHLPDIVEKVVSRELERLSKRI